ncbi:MAG TPA: hypothetical protein VN851_14045 [Thermoanaerobaculia bacterium]|nr:hypothetical protein [Thermoanaerobaculia bacterium]
MPKPDSELRPDTESDLYPTGPVLRSEIREALPHGNEEMETIHRILSEAVASIESNLDRASSSFGRIEAKLDRFLAG